uniref:Elongator complex protein 2 n=1 Tax=Aceria tosichella TaxID=561515 RepID=A0A6G1SGC1_9ACAR
MANTGSIQDELVYASISSNRNENNISCSGNFLLYSRCQSPIIYNLKTKLVASILIGHSGEVNGQCFVENSPSNLISQPEDKQNSIHVISTAHDCSAIIWRVDGGTTTEGNTSHYEILLDIKSPDDSVFTTRCSYLSDGHFFSVLTTMNGNICVYHDDKLLQTIPTEHCYFDAKFYLTNYTEADSSSVYSLVALAGSDNRLHIFNLNSDLRLDHVQDLSGFNDWIKCLDFLTLPDRPNEFLLATACQDSLIQVWLLKLTKFELDETAQVRTKVSKLDESGIKLTCTLETVLSGHEGFVHSLCWFKRSCNAESNLLQLLSCSSDKTIAIWKSSIAKQNPAETNIIKKYEQCPASEGIWKELARFGETGEANLPFLGVCLSDDEMTLYAQSLRGAIHSWSMVTEDRKSESPWTPSETICGHFDSVTDLAWEKTGAYLLSSSLDKTCRLHAIAAKDNRWHELARPQVHGYEINCLASLSFLKFASGAEEKTIRTFEVTKFFIKNYEALAKTDLPAYCKSDLKSHLFDELPVHAQLPALGLSNRGSQYPVDVNEDDSAAIAMNATQQSGDSNNSGKPILSDNNSWQEVGDLVHQLVRIDHLDSLPFEEILLQSTLWWENNKLFGHSNELHALACDSTGSFLASASKANRFDLASVILWETEKFRKVAFIEHHSLTITRLRFSPDDKYLLSVSRDRTWCLSERNSSGQLRNAYKKLVGTFKSNAVHERIIWDCSWTHDSRYFLTVSRDKKAILWSVDGLRAQLNQSATMTTTATSDTSDGQHQSTALNLNYVSSKQFSVSIQAVDSAQAQTNVNNDSPSYLFVLGFEDGSVELYSVGINIDNEQDRWQLLKCIPNLHQLSVRRLAFQPMQQQSPNENKEETNNETSFTGTRDLMLASGGDDCMVRLTRFHFRA